MTQTCPHNAEWLRHSPDGSRVDCRECGTVWVSQAVIQRALDRLKHNTARQIGDILPAEKHTTQKQGAERWQKC